MMTIKVNLKDDYIVTKINGTLTEVAEYYFGSHLGVETIEILDGWENENEYFEQIPMKYTEPAKKILKNINYTTIYAFVIAWNTNKDKPKTI